MKKLVYYTLVVIIIINIINITNNNEIIPNESIRMRVIPNSNSTLDQNIKNKVKKYLENNTYNLIKDEDSKEIAKEKIKNNDTDWMNIFKKKEKINELNRLLIDELIEDIVVSEDGNIKVIFKYEDKYFEALDFINKQKYDIILSS